MSGSSCLHYPSLLRADNPSEDCLRFPIMNATESFLPRENGLWRGNMCGIVGLLVKKREQRASLGQLAQPMFTCMGERGPDSGGLAVFGSPVAAPQRRFNLFVPDRHFDWQAL